jgi:tetratricopeptide (TPR) repeat protein
MSSSSSQLIQTGLKLHQAGRLQEAESCYQAVLREQPKNSDAWHLLGVIAQQIGKDEVAVELIEKAIDIRPDVADYYVTCGEAYRAMREYDSATHCYEKALSINPGFAGAHLNLGNTLKETGRVLEAIGHYEKAVALQPDFAIALNNLGIALKEIGRTEDAITRFERALAIAPGYFEAYNNLGNALLAVDRFDAAISRFEQAIAIQPKYAEAHSNLGNAFRQSGRLEDAIRQYKEAVSCKPDFAMGHYNLGIALEETGRAEEAIASYLQALSIDSGFAEAHHNLGFAFQDLGRKDEAIASYQRAIAHKPEYASAYLHLSMIEPQLEQASVIEALLEQSSLDDKDTVLCHFALGNIYHDAEQFEQAFDHYLVANTLKRNTITYEPQSHTDFVDRLTETYSKTYFRNLGPGGSDSNLPLFIVGMPRSGTTLVEQIISSHPQVYGAGEIEFIGRIEERLAGDYAAKSDYPECMNSCSKETPVVLAREYLEQVRRYSGEAVRITDKDPGNFHRIGLIKTLFPKARIFHCQRNPMDTCASIFFNHFAKGNEYAFNLDELGHYYIDYENLMSHWKSLFPEDIMTVEYENLVKNQEEVSRRLIDHAGLDWDDLCLRFHDNTRAVRTASSSQVREPIYTRSVNRWKQYEKQLLPLAKILDRA